MKIHREGYRYIIIATILWIGLGWLAGHFIPVMWLAGIITFILFLAWFWVVAFFRLPSRNFVHGEDKIIAPADGKVVVIERTQENEYFHDERIQVSIFMSPLNVHINRHSVSGIVKYFKYHPGKYLVAWHPKSSTENERTTVVVKTDNNQKVLFRQIAGAVARRICYYCKAGDHAEQGSEMGFIKFGSRVDIFLPLTAKINSKLNDVVKGGETVIAEF